MSVASKDQKVPPKANLVGGDTAENSSGKDAVKTPDELATQSPELFMSPTAYVASLPKVVKRRLKALKKLQVLTNLVEAKFFEELHKLECNYQLKYEQIFLKRADIINARMEPTDEQCEWPNDEDDPLSDSFAHVKIGDIDDKDLPDNLKLDETTKGIPDFWLTIFKNVDMLRAMVQPHDIPILKHLQDIKVHLDTEKGFTLDFLFEENEFFTNTVLTKTYYLKFNPQKDEELLYEGPEVYKCTGTTIDWKPNKNVTVRLVKKVQKHKGRGTKRVLTKTVQNDSFFNFFNPPMVSENENEMDEETDTLLEADFEIGQFIRERIVPRAILYYTGELVDDEDDEYDDEDEAGDDEDEDEN
ncbi:hypothetical protein HELRODRAFT_110599 [Helobdella robusta]|uniref:Nucleosome assembly protein 1-like 1 n=1 Tax=Helobdella robusta TaxID=6412 RepID=T1EF34_HELRO|nr:hypothetical protein HELRODRAFT_110599 [Helobdella robusta]ESO07807.1 hypothetical protein HELRODRAFT_110599 [Helobdella robusta]